MLTIKDVSVSFRDGNEWNHAVKSISFSLPRNKILGVVGESGSGKSVTSLALLGLLPEKDTKISGEVFFNQQELLNFSEGEFRQIRGSEIAMIFQEPMTSLNPTLSCGKQVAEVFKTHTKLSNKEIKTEVLQLFEKVKLPRPAAMYDSYPHQISGGQKQRVMIAMAIACKPKLLIADEPTTALDVTVQKEIILLLKEIQSETKMSILFISHDLALISEIADEVIVMYKGEIVEQGDVRTIFKNPKKEYTKALMNAKPSLNERLEKLPTVADFGHDFIPQEITARSRSEAHAKIYGQRPILEVQNLFKEYITKTSFFNKNEVVKAIDDVSFNLYEGETLGLVGESGCGKTTLGRTILKLEKQNAGKIFYKGKDITQLKGRELKNLRKEIQIIFQDPFSSLNPRITVDEAILEPMKVHKIGANAAERKQYVFDLLEKVGLEKEHFYRYPHEFSGGQRQRIGIARIIALQPKIIICDESVSALDVSVQAQVLNLLNDLKGEFGFTYIFISHDLSVVKYMSDQLIVMNKGQIEEIGDADEIYKSPQSDCTKKLINSIPKGI